MKKLLLAVTICLLTGNFCLAQNHTPGPVEQKVTATLCDCLGQIDQSKITTSKEAKDAFMNCFMAQAGSLTDLAAERKVSVDDGNAMHTLGLDIGKNLLNQKCDAFLKLSVKMAQKNGDPETQATSGIFKRIDNKGFNYIVITDENGSEKSFLWLRQFNGSEKFINSPAALTGKKLNISWQGMEVYLPQAKGYFAVKEITSVTVL